MTDFGQDKYDWTDEEIYEYIKIEYEKIEPLLPKFEMLLNLTYCHIKDEQVHILTKFLDEHPEVIKLMVSSQYLRKDGIKKLAQNTTLKYLYLIFPHYISLEGVKSLADNKKLEALYLLGHPSGQMKISQEGVEALADNTTLKGLHIHAGQIGDEGAKILARNKTLIELSLIYNNIGDEGASALAKNKTLRCVNLGSNCIGKKIEEELQPSTKPEIMIGKQLQIVTV